MPARQTVYWAGMKRLSSKVCSDKRSCINTGIYSGTTVGSSCLLRSESLFRTGCPGSVAEKSRHQTAHGEARVPRGPTVVRGTLQERVLSLCACLCLSELLSVLFSNHRTQVESVLLVCDALEAAVCITAYFYTRRETSLPASSLLWPQQQTPRSTRLSRACTGARALAGREVSHKVSP